jgi:hypothetical protein
MKRAEFLFVSWVVIALTIAVPGPIALLAQTQASEQRPTFEVASIKQNTSDVRRSFGVQPGGRLVVRNAALKDLIAASYGMAQIQALVPERILGGRTGSVPNATTSMRRRARSFTSRQAVRPRTCF